MYLTDKLFTRYELSASVSFQDFDYQQPKKYYTMQFDFLLIHR
jgi:hypothetical protein